MVQSVIAQDWKPTAKARPGFYQSPMYPDLFFKRRQAGHVLPEAAIRLASQHSIAREIIDDGYSAAGKKLSSEDAQRYGTAISRKALLAYFDWRSSVGLTWWKEQEKRYPMPANDNNISNQTKAAA